MKECVKAFDPIILVAYVLESAVIFDIIEFSDLNFCKGAGDSVLITVT